MRFRENRGYNLSEWLYFSPLSSGTSPPGLSKRRRNAPPACGIAREAPGFPFCMRRLHCRQLGRNLILLSLLLHRLSSLIESFPTNFGVFVSTTPKNQWISEPQPRALLLTSRPAWTTMSYPHCRHHRVRRFRDCSFQYRPGAGAFV